jgi:CheY-like chemotaxis protein
MTSDQYSILVVDDVKLDRELLRGLLVRKGYNVQTAEDGLQALEIMMSEAFDLVLLDILMPRLDGYQLLEKMKSEKRLKDIPVIMITTVTEIDSVIRCIESGAEDYLTKPYNRILLNTRIEKCLEKKYFRDKEQVLLAKVQEEKEKSENLRKIFSPNRSRDD